MIFVVLGTHELPFTRLLNEIDFLIEEGVIGEEVIVQLGHTPYKSENMKFIPFMTYAEMENYYKKARLIITHGGTGSITSGVKMGKKIIAVPRWKKYGEHNDDHQLEIVRQFYHSGHILYWDDGFKLKEVLEMADSFQPREFVSGREKILTILDDFIKKNV
ncbi:exopolysaccharide biosynthesis protein [Rossellomorea vietnamensis]|uniref:Exopolysaccharide biosynthesis protein n=1 Tax=Rossellomorea vietnamensis TaxID=218284 RepID=A0A5D4MAI2_9BACI|nr:PssE/Cps14G family polysaccharide biosynthesis glycosyltransferase [Rossellomorea vietnamensis]TYR98949.1 exopolysaccharide biosynthesis protein [Rossellomorea vietnamensis]